MGNPSAAKYATTKSWNAANLASFTVGTKSVNTINVAVQLKDAHAKNAVGPLHLFCYLASSADGATVSPTAPTTTLAVGTKGSLAGLHSNSVGFHVVSDSSGVFDVNVIQTAGGTNYYLVVCFPDGSIAVSPIISF